MDYWFKTNKTITKWGKDLDGGAQNGGGSRLVLYTAYVWCVYIFFLYSFVEFLETGKMNEQFHL